MAYDPQRNRVRTQPAADEPAPVDMVLEGTTEQTVLEGTTEQPVLAPADAHEHEHGPDCDHDHGYGTDLRLIVVAGVATVAATVFALRRRRAARR